MTPLGESAFRQLRNKLGDFIRLFRNIQRGYLVVLLLVLSMGVPDVIRARASDPSFSPPTGCSPGNSESYATFVTKED